MIRILVILSISCYLVQNVKSDSSEEDSDYSSSWLAEKEEPQNAAVSCIDYINIEDVESCFTAQCAAECVGDNLKVPEESQVRKSELRTFSFILFPECTRKLQLGL